MKDGNPEQRIRGEFFQKTLDSLRSHIAVLNEDGTIIVVNAAWNKFASGNGLADQSCGPGANYLRSCDQATGENSEEAIVVATGIRRLLSIELLIQGLCQVFGRSR